MSPSPSSREAAQMANEQPLNLVQLVADYIFYWKFKHNVRVALTTLSRRLIITMVIWE
ncbi:protein of unknown function [Lactiplantibacillus plantarum]